MEEKRPRRSSISKLSRRANCFGWLVWSQRRTLLGSSRLDGAAVSDDMMFVVREAPRPAPCDHLGATQGLSAGRRQDRSEVM